MIRPLQGRVGLCRVKERPGSRQERSGLNCRSVGRLPTFVGPTTLSIPTGTPRHPACLSWPRLSRVSPACIIACRVHPLHCFQNRLCLYNMNEADSQLRSTLTPCYSKPISTQTPSPRSIDKARQRIQIQPAKAVIEIASAITRITKDSD